MWRRWANNSWIGRTTCLVQAKCRPASTRDVNIALFFHFFNSHVVAPSTFFLCMVRARSMSMDNFRGEIDGSQWAVRFCFQHIAHGADSRHSDSHKCCGYPWCCLNIELSTMNMLGTRQYMQHPSYFMIVACPPRCFRGFPLRARMRLANYFCSIEF